MDKDLERFLSHVDQYELVDICWIWQASHLKSGYGSFWHEGKVWYAHRWVYTYFYGEIAPGLQVDHLCNVKLCVNPMHLEAVTPSTNMLRIGRQETHCKRGHELSEENTRIYKKSNGLIDRRCKECEQLRNQDWRASH